MKDRWSTLNFGLLLVLVLIIVPFVVSQKEKDGSIKVVSEVNNGGTLAAPSIAQCGNHLILPQEQMQDQYTTANSSITSDVVRTLAMGTQYLILGHANGKGVDIFTGTGWLHCITTAHVNSIVQDNQGRIWVGTDGEGVSMFNGVWHNYTSPLDPRIYNIVLFDNDVYATTWEGVWKFEKESWTQVFSMNFGNIRQQHIHAMAALPVGDFFFGSIQNGGTWVKRIVGDVYQFIALTTQEQNQVSYVKPVLGSNNLRRIAVNPYHTNEVWFVSDAGDATTSPGLVKYDYNTDSWSQFLLPDNRGQDIAFGPFGEPIVATTGGTFDLKNYLVSNAEPQWNTIASDPSYTVVTGCQGCTFHENDVFIGTNGNGLRQLKIQMNINSSGAATTGNAHPDESKKFKLIGLILIGILDLLILLYRFRNSIFRFSKRKNGESNQTKFF